MNEHSHITLCDEYLNLLYDHVSFDIYNSVDEFLNLAFSIFYLERLDRKEIQMEMHKRIDEKNKNPIYFRSGDLIYLWIQCNNCRLSGMN